MEDCGKSNAIFTIPNINEQVVKNIPKWYVRLL